MRGLLTAVLLLFCLTALAAGCSRTVIRRDDAEFHENKGDQFYEKGDFDAALREYTRAMDMGSQKLKVFNNLGNVHIRKGQLELAEKYYRKALAIDPAYLFSLNNLALTLYRQGKGAEARNLLGDTLKRTGGNSLLLNTLGLILIREGDVTAGVGMLGKAVEKNPDYAVGLNNLGDIYLKNPDLGEDPLPFIMRAIEKDPDNKLFYDTLGWYYCRMGVFDEALLALGKAFVQDPENVEIRVHYATALEWLGKDKEAMEQWQAVLDMPGDHDLLTLARQHYWELKGR